MVARGGSGAEDVRYDNSCASPWCPHGMLQKFLDTGTTAQQAHEVTGLSRDGSEFPSAGDIAGKAGDEWTFSAFIRDLTEPRKVAQALKLRTADGNCSRKASWTTGVARRSSDRRQSGDGQNLAIRPRPLLAIPSASLYVNPADQFKTKEMRGKVPCSTSRSVTARGWPDLGKDTAFVKRNSTARQLYEGILEDISLRVEAERALQA